MSRRRYRGKDCSSLPDLGEHGNVTDWLKAGGSKQQLLQLAKAALMWTPAAASADNSEPVATPRLVFRGADEVVSLVGEKPDVLVEPGLVIAGAITAIDGKAKEAGKTSLILEALVRPLLEGGIGPDGRPTAQTSIVYLTEQNGFTFTQAIYRAGLQSYPRERLSICSGQKAVTFPMRRSSRPPRPKPCASMRGCWWLTHRVSGPASGRRGKQFGRRVAVL